MCACGSIFVYFVHVFVGMCLCGLCELLRDVVWALFWSCVFVCVICLRVLCVIYRVVLYELLVLRGCLVFVCSLNGFACFVSDSLCDGVFCVCRCVCCCVFCG